MKRRLGFLKGYHNIIILILILAVLFFFGRIILNKNSFADTKDTNKNLTNLQSSRDSSWQNKFLVHAIHQVFPIKEAQEKINITSYVNQIYTSFIYNILKVNFKDPITFVQHQFPFIDSYNNIENHYTIQKPTLEPSGNDIKDVFLVEVNNDNKLVNVGAIPTQNELENIGPEEKDDLGELWQGIYLVGDDDIVDSLDSAKDLLENIKKPKKIEFQQGKPHILIYHTHGTESYKPASEGNYHSLRKEYSVIAIGEILKEELEKKGFNVIHDITYHDYPSYSGSYTRSLETAQKILKENPSIKVILDVHRDGYDNIDTNPNKNNIIANNRITINNEIVSRFQMVIGPETPNRQEVETFAAFIKAVSDKKYPGFSKPILVKPYGRFNQFLADHYALLEVGSNANTIEEARGAAVYLADVLAEALSYIKK